MRKRVLSMLCAVMMLCCMAGTAMAAELPETVPEEATPLTELLEQRGMQLRKHTGNF